jgi:glycosyltransferase involved in cell wall biosynthesis
MIEEFIEKWVARGRARAGDAGAADEEAARRLHRLQQTRLRLERLGSRALPARSRIRVAATACWEFPVYSQTFVYQELSELATRGFDLRFLYSKLNPRSHMPAQFSPVWRSKRKLVLHPAVCESDYAYYRERMPEKVNALIAKLCSASMLSPEELQSHYHFKQAFSFTRTVAACRPDYLHSYFFYEGTLFAYVASFLLDIPRGVSCYADHMLHDYALKVVGLHLDQCSVVIATSARIKRELMGIAPQVDPDRILVKPNAIDSRRFPFRQRSEPAPKEPFTLVCVSRIEPKKGILYLVDAVRKLLDRGLNVRAHVLGGVDNSDACKEYAATVKARIRELNMLDVFRLEGRRPGPEIQEFLNRAHLFVAPFVETESGDKDGIPTALLEAMATGLPCVVTNAGSIEEVVTDGRDGLVVPQRDAEALCEAIAAALSDPARRQAMGAEAASKVRKHFDVGVCEERFHRRVREVTRHNERSHSRRA